MSTVFAIVCLLIATNVVAVLWLSQYRIAGKQ